MLLKNPNKTLRVFNKGVFCGGNPGSLHPVGKTVSTVTMNIGDPFRQNSENVDSPLSIAEARHSIPCPFPSEHMVMLTTSKYLLIKTLHSGLFLVLSLLS